MSPLYLHIGMPRTGTTLLQKEVFPRLQGVNMVDFRRRGVVASWVCGSGLRGDKELKGLLKELENCDYQAVRQAVQSRLEEDMVNLISEENIYCRMWQKSDLRICRLEALKRCFPETNIIFGVRDKPELCRSWYKKYVGCGGTRSFNDFQREVINPAKLDYADYVQRLRQLFGNDRVHVYRFEPTRDGIRAMVQGICQFMGVAAPGYVDRPRNRGYSSWQLAFSRIANCCFRTDLNPAGIIPLAYKWHPHRLLFQDVLPRVFRARRPDNGSATAVAPVSAPEQACAPAEE